jgi:hypothetical protein
VVVSILIMLKPPNNALPTNRKEFSSKHVPCRKPDNLPNYCRHFPKRLILPINLNSTFSLTVPMGYDQRTTALMYSTSCFMIDAVCLAHDKYPDRLSACDAIIHSAVFARCLEEGCDLAALFDEKTGNTYYCAKHNETAKIDVPVAADFVQTITINFGLLPEEVSLVLFTVSNPVKSCPLEMRDLESSGRLTCPDFYFRFSFTRFFGVGTFMVCALRKVRSPKFGAVWYLETIQEQIPKHSFELCHQEMLQKVMSLTGYVDQNLISSEDLIDEATSRGRCFAWFIGLSLMNFLFGGVMIALEHKVADQVYYNHIDLIHDTRHYLTNSTLVGQELLDFLIENQDNLSPPEREWHNIVDAVGFALTIMTTIGYGRHNPHTVGGQLGAILYSIVSIPCCAIGLGYFSKFVVTFFMRFYRHFKIEERNLFNKYNIGSAPVLDRGEIMRAVKDCGIVLQSDIALSFLLGAFEPSKPLQELNFEQFYCFLNFVTRGQKVTKIHQSKIVKGLLLAVCFSFTVSVIYFSRFEDWDAWDSFYFCWFTSTTVGFGDYYPAKYPFNTFYLYVYVLFALGNFIYHV